MALYYDNRALVFFKIEEKRIYTAHNLLIEMFNRSGKSKKLVLLFISFCLSFLIAEIIMGYVLFQRDSKQGRSALLRVATKLIGKQESAAPIRDYLIRLNYLYTDKATANPFVTYRLNAEYKYHPFIDLTGVHALPGHLQQHPENIKLDYFGFRNRDNIYFDKKRDYTLVVITGGSEVAGVSHEVTISENLERILNSSAAKKYKVINLGMNSYTVANEINAYTNLVYHLQPEYVISHTGWNDVLYSLMVPERFKRLALNYPKTLESWLPRLYDLKQASDDKWKLNELGHEFVVPALIYQYGKYRNIVQSNKGLFILGIQSFNHEWDIAKIANEHNVQLIYERARMLHRSLVSSLPSRKRIDFNQYQNNLSFVDSVHTDEASSRFIAGIYAEQILNASKSSFR